MNLSLITTLVSVAGLATSILNGDPVPKNELPPPPLPVLSPTALTGDAGNQKAYLRWNLQLEDERVVGWRAQQLAPVKKQLNDTLLTEPVLVVDGLSNGVASTFTVVGVLKNGKETPPSNAVTVTPRDVGLAKVVALGGQKIAVGAAPEVALGPNAVKVTFPDGQELVYDRLRPMDWKARDGEHLLEPRHFGNGLDIGKFDERGLPVVIPPQGMKIPRPNQPEFNHAPTDPVNPEYRDVQFGTQHPWITDPLTQSLGGQRGNDARPNWLPPVVAGDRVTFHYWQPLEAMGYRSWTYVLVWETWWPIERERHGTKYHGLARLIEVEMPSALKDGYQVMLNNGFGPSGGSRQGVVSYSTGFREPAAEIVDFSGDKNRAVTWQNGKSPRQGSGYHPDQDCLQSSPLIFYDWSGRPKPGSLTIAARSLYYHCANQSSSYVEQGADGVWPNLAWDLALTGKRTAVDTVEYLFAPDVSQPLPQRFVNARFETYADVSRRMGLQDELGAVAMDTPHSQIEREGGPEKFADVYIKRLENTGTDVCAMYHDIWHAVPITVDDAYRFDENHDCNPALKTMCAKLKAAGLHPGFWFRPEFTKTSLPSALSERIPTAEIYYGYDMAKYPNVVALLHERGIPLFRENTHWIRKHRDGTDPFRTPYEWVPMSLATEWFDRIIWPSQWMSAKLGFERVLVDGGFGGLPGVDYAPMLAGKAAGAVACQPYWWRMWRCMEHVGIRMYGECTVGWKGGNVHAGGPSDQHYQWMFHLGWYIGLAGALQSPEQTHRTFQLYNSTRNDAGTAAVRRFALKFYAQHRAPDWIEFQNLRQTDPVDVTLKAGPAPVAGNDTRPAGETPAPVRVRPWTWTDVVWHYDDGTQVVYPAFDKVNWNKE